MNSAVITKIEYKLPDQENFIVLDIVPESGKLKQDPKQTSAGMVYTAISEFLIAGISGELDYEIKSINHRKAYFRITDADDVVYMVGSPEFPARLSAQLDMGGTPGAFKGYRGTITHNSTTGCTIQ
jgi:hypothetical protein